MPWKLQVATCWKLTLHGSDISDEPSEVDFSVDSTYCHYFVYSRFPIGETQNDCCLCCALRKCNNIRCIAWLCRFHCAPKIGLCRHVEPLNLICLVRPVRLWPGDLSFKKRSAQGTKRYLSRSAVFLKQLQVISQYYNQKHLVETNMAPQLQTFNTWTSFYKSTSSNCRTAGRQLM